MTLRRLRRLETIVRLRKQEEDARMRALSSVREEIAAAERQRDSIAHMQRMMLEEAAARTRSRFSTDEMQRFYQFERHLAGIATDTDASIQELEQVASERLEDLRRANQRKRTMERLTGNAAAARHEELTKSERALIDEVAINRAAADRRHKL